MNDLKKYAGLLNDIAPKGEFLAYINEDESDLLKSKGALGIMTAQGIPSYIGSDASGQGGGSGGQGFGGGGGSGNNGNNGDNDDADRPGGIDASRSDFNSPKDDPYGGGVSGVQTGLTTPNAPPNTVSGDDSTKTKLDYLDSPEYKNLRDLTPDEIETLDEQTKQAIYSITPSKDPKNIAIGLGLNLLGIPFASTLYNNYIDGTAMGYSLDNPFGNLGDFFDGSTTPNTPPTEFEGGGGRDFMNTVAPGLPFAIAGQVAPDSMVNQYFANQPTSGSGLSSDLQTSYNNAKNNISSILGTNQQFGYSAQPYGLLSSTNMADNPFNIPYLQQRGLI